MVKRIRKQIRVMVFKVGWSVWPIWFMLSAIVIAYGVVLLVRHPLGTNIEGLIAPFLLIVAGIIGAMLIFILNEVVPKWPEFKINEARDLIKNQPALQTPLAPIIDRTDATGNTQELDQWLASFRKKALATSELERIEQELNRGNGLRQRREELRQKISELSQQLGL